MKSRCFNSKILGYHNYGGRGITVCDRWAYSFENFYADMGDPPDEGMSIDRIDNDGPYSPDNCRWATLEEQGRNKRTTRFLTFEGESLIVKDWLKKTGTNKSTYYRRLKRGLTPEQALFSSKNLSSS